MDTYNATYHADVDQSLELNENMPINYNAQNYMTNDARENSVESINIDNADGKKSDYYNDQIGHPQYAIQEESYILIWKYIEQIKSISAGCLLLFCGGLHIVWAIYQVLSYETSEKYRQHLSGMNSTKLADRLFKRVMFSQRTGLVFTIIMWYIGMMLGSFVAGWYVVRVVQKKNIYYISALIMFVSGCLFYSVDAADSGWQALLTSGRFFAGIAHGIVYVTILTQASENAAKDFRRILISMIGGIIGFSIFFASTFLIFVPFPEIDDKNDNEAEKSEKTAAGIISATSIFFAFISVPLNYFFTHETVPFLLYHNYREEEAYFTLGTLLGEESNSAVVQNEFQAIKETCITDFTDFEENKIFQSAHRGLLSFAISARISAAQSFNIPTVVLFVKIIQEVILHSMREEPIEEEKITINQNETILIIVTRSEVEKSIVYYNRTVTSFLFTWFVFGLVFMLLGNYFRWKRVFHFMSFLAGASILTCVILVFIGIFSKFVAALAFLVLIIYFQFLSFPVDVLGLTYLAECFPASTRAKSIAFVTLCECGFNIILVTVNLRYYKLEPEFIPMGIILCILGYKLFRSAPNTNGFPLAAARQAYLEATIGKKWWQP